MALAAGVESEGVKRLYGSLAPGLLSTRHGGGAKTMNLSKTIEHTLVPANPFSTGGHAFEVLVFFGSLIMALLFLAYLARCYFQEFRRKRKIERRKRISRATCNANSFHPILWNGGPRLEAPEERSSEASQPLVPVKLDCWRLQWAIPQHEQITMVWENSGSSEASAAHCVRRGTVRKVATPR
jgi:hypothetical protein